MLELPLMYCSLHCHVCSGGLLRDGEVGQGPANLQERVTDLKVTPHACQALCHTSGPTSPHPKTHTNPQSSRSLEGFSSEMSLLELCRKLLSTQSRESQGRRPYTNCFCLDKLGSGCRSNTVLLMDQWGSPEMGVELPVTWRMHP